MGEFTQPAKAIEAVIYLGNIPLKVYQLPDGSYKLDAVSVTEAIERKGADLLRFLKGSSPQALPYKGYSLVRAETVEVEGDAKFIKPIPVALATAYWFHSSIKGNKNAQALTQASMDEAIERRADKAFDVKRSETDYDRHFAMKLEEMLLYNREEIEALYLPGDDLYYPVEID